MNSKKLPKINREISASEVRVIDENKNMIGVLPIRDAFFMARNKGLDLIEISPNSSPPVCQIGEFGKLKYELQKKEAEERKKAKNNETKEVKFNINIATHDYQVKINHILNFINDEYSVKVSSQVKGRDRAYARERLPILFERIIKDVSSVANLQGKMEVKDNGGDFILVSKPKQKT